MMSFLMHWLKGRAGTSWLEPFLYGLIAAVVFVLVMGVQRWLVP